LNPIVLLVTPAEANDPAQYRWLRYIDSSGHTVVHVVERDGGPSYPLEPWLRSHGWGPGGLRPARPHATIAP
jgi:hypothetical protein